MSFRPSDQYPRSAARITNYGRLLDEFERKQDDRTATVHDWQALCAIAVARVGELERKLSVQERRVIGELYGGPRESVDNVVPIRRNKEAPTRLSPLGA